MDSPNPEIYKYEIPGGQYSNFAAQVKEMGAGNDSVSYTHLDVYKRQALKGK